MANESCEKKYASNGDDKGKGLEDDEAIVEETPPDEAMAAFIPAEIATGVRK